MSLNRPQTSSKKRLITARLSRRLDMTNDLWKIWLKPSQGFTFKPGQYCTIGSGSIERAYSIASAPEEDELEIFIEYVPPPEGHLTPLLYGLQEGAEVTLRPRAKGIFLFRPQHQVHVMIATVTGIAPYVSMLRQLQTTNALGNYQIHVLEGASYHDEFGYDDELHELTQRANNVRFTPTVSRPYEGRNSNWHGTTRRVNTLVGDYLQQHALTPDKTVVYACGHPQMIEDVKVQAIQGGYYFEEERFWKE